MQTEDGRLFIIAGASRSGKTAWTYRRLKAEKRVLVWDIEAQWSEMPGFRRVTTKEDLYQACKTKGPAKIAYVSSAVDVKKDFDFWAGIALYWGRYYGPCAAVAEELADVSSQGKAPGNWGILQRRGLKRGIDIYAVSQRWAEADKTGIGNASEYICFSMTGDDVEYMAKKTRIPVEKLEALLPPSDHNPVVSWYRKDRLSGKVEYDHFRLPARKK